MNKVYLKCIFFTDALQSCIKLATKYKAQSKIYFEVKIKNK